LDLTTGPQCRSARTRRAGAALPRVGLAKIREALRVLVPKPVAALSYGHRVLPRL